jgi:hypothetical protein
MSLPHRAGPAPVARVDDPLALVSVRYFERARAEAIELSYAYGGSERVDGTAGYAADVAYRAGLRPSPTSDGTRLWVKVSEDCGSR